MVYPIVKLTLIPIIKLWIKEVEGLENIPKDGGFIVCPNHSSFYDDVLIPSIVVPKINKTLHMYVNKKYFKNFLLRKFLYWAGSIPVEVYEHPDKKTINEQAFKKAMDYLKKGEPIGIYPEGHRTLDGELQKAKSGAARLALTAKVPILPVGIIGSLNILPKGKMMLRFKKIVKVKIGKPLFFTEYYKKHKDKKTLDDITRTIMKEIGKLTNKNYNH